MLLFFFFSSRRRHTRYWRDWSSDVCSSDLPFPDSDISEEALAVTKLTREEIFRFDSPQVTCEIFTQILGKYVDKYNKNDKFTVVGHNVKFDLDMLRNWAYRCNEIGRAHV